MKAKISNVFNCVNNYYFDTISAAAFAGSGILSSSKAWAAIGLLLSIGAAARGGWQHARSRHFIPAGLQNGAAANANTENPDQRGRSELIP
jgi:hypothetical protein